MIPPRTGKGVVVVHVLRSYCLRFSFSRLFSDVCFLFSIRIVGAFFSVDFFFVPGDASRWNARLLYEKEDENNFAPFAASTQGGRPREAAAALARMAAWRAAFHAKGALSPAVGQRRLFPSVSKSRRGGVGEQYRF